MRSTVLLVRSTKRCPSFRGLTITINNRSQGGHIDWAYVLAFLALYRPVDRLSKYSNRRSSLPLLIRFQGWNDQCFITPLLHSFFLLIFQIEANKKIVTCQKILLHELRRLKLRFVKALIKISSEVASIRFTLVSCSFLIPSKILQLVVFPFFRWRYFQKLC